MHNIDGRLVKCIIGLGNPGQRYRYSRHNIGFNIAEALIEKLSATHLESTEIYECYRAQKEKHDILVVMPQTYMNNSGFAIRELYHKYKIEFSDFLVVYDDFQLPLGTLRLRPKGSDGGHNGLGSIIYQLQTDMVPRIRVGVAGLSIPEQHTKELMASYVLSRFDPEEEKFVPQFIQHAVDSCLSWIDDGIEKTMNLFNKNFLTFSQEKEK